MTTPLDPVANGDDLDHADRWLRTLQHCALHRRTIRLTCPICGHVRSFDAVALWWMYERRGWDDALPGAYRRMYCTGCKTKRDAVVRPRAEITRDRPDAQQPPYPDEATWKRIVSRYWS